MLGEWLSIEKGDSETTGWSCLFIVLSCHCTVGSWIQPSTLFSLLSTHEGRWWANLMTGPADSYCRDPSSAMPNNFPFQPYVKEKATKASGKPF